MDQDVLTKRNEVQMKMLKNSFLQKTPTSTTQNELQKMLELCNQKELDHKSILAIIEYLSYKIELGQKHLVARARRLLVELRLEFSLRDNKYYKNYDFYCMEDTGLRIDAAALQGSDFPRIVETYATNFKTTFNIVGKIFKEMKTNGLAGLKDSVLSFENLNKILIVKLLARGDEDVDHNFIVAQLNSSDHKHDFRDFQRFCHALMNNELDLHLDFVRNYIDKNIKDYRIFLTKNDRGSAASNFFAALQTITDRCNRLLEMDRKESGKLAHYIKRTCLKSKGEIKDSLSTLEHADLLAVLAYIKERNEEFPLLADEFALLKKYIELALGGSAEETELNKKALEEVRALQVDFRNFGPLYCRIEQLIRETSDAPTLEFLTFLKELLSDCVTSKISAHTLFKIR